MKCVLILSTLLITQISFSALPGKFPTTKNKAVTTSNQSEIYQQLTGKPVAVVPAKVVASAEKALMLARQSRDSKNYILAIKRYNFILKYYAKTNQAKLALMDKSLMYKEMGLPEQAAYNQKRVKSLSKAAVSTKTIKR